MPFNLDTFPIIELIEANENNDIMVLKSFSKNFFEMHLTSTYFKFFVANQAPFLDLWWPVLSLI